MNDQNNAESTVVANPDASGEIVVDADGNAENVGTFSNGDVVWFNPRFGDGQSVEALVVRNYGTADGKVLYNLALAFDTKGAFGETQYHEDRPLKDVDSIYVSGKPNPATRNIFHITAGDTNWHPTAEELHDLCCAFYQGLESTDVDVVFAGRPGITVTKQTFQHGDPVEVTAVAATTADDVGR